MNIKKVIIVAALVSAMVLMLVVPCFAAENTTIRGEQISTTAGQTVEYRVSISGNPGLAGFLIKLAYDTSVFTPVSVDDGNEIWVECDSFPDAGNMIASQNTRGCQVLWYSLNETTLDGILFTVKLQIKEGTALGAYPITISYSAKNTFNAAEEQVTLVCCNGSITVREFSPTIYGDSIDVLQGEEFDYSVYIQDNPGIASCGFTLGFDPTRFELVTKDDAVVYSQGEAFGDAGGSLSVKGYLNGAAVFWYAYRNSSDVGKVMSLRLRAKKNATLGPSTLSITPTSGQILDETEQEIRFQGVAGGINVKCSARVQVTLTGQTSAAISVTDAPAKYAVAAFYEQSGRMVNASIETLKNGAVSFSMNSSSADLSKCTWKVFLLDESYRPVCTCYTTD